MCDREHARQLLDMAKRDLIAAAAMTDPETFPDEIAGFLFQQALEKALNAWLASLGVEYPKTHDISLLLRRLNELHLNVDRFSSLLEFTSFAVQFRISRTYVFHETTGSSIFIPFGSSISALGR